MHISRCIPKLNTTERLLRRASSIDYEIKRCGVLTNNICDSDHDRILYGKQKYNFKYSSDKQKFRIIVVRYIIPR